MFGITIENKQFPTSVKWKEALRFEAQLRPHFLFLVDCQYDIEADNDSLERFADKQGLTLVFQETPHGVFSKITVITFEELYGVKSFCTIHFGAKCDMELVKTYMKRSQYVGLVSNDYNENRFIDEAVHYMSDFEKIEYVTICCEILDKTTIEVIGEHIPRMKQLQKLQLVGTHLSPSRFVRLTFLMKDVNIDRFFMDSSFLLAKPSEAPKLFDWFKSVKDKRTYPKLMYDYKGAPVIEEITDKKLESWKLYVDSTEGLKSAKAKDGRGVDQVLSDLITSYLVVDKPKV